MIIDARRTPTRSPISLAGTELERGKGESDRKDGATRFTAIVLRPRLRLPAGADQDLALRILEKSENGMPRVPCFKPLFILAIKVLATQSEEP